jgi:hypothetical protein
MSKNEDEMIDEIEKDETEVESYVLDENDGEEDADEDEAEAEEAA